MSHLLRTACSALTAAAFVPHALGAPLVQGVGDNYIAFEAESNVDLVDDGDGNGWAVSGGELVSTLGSHQDVDTATWTMQFNQAGTYQLYVRARASDIGSPSDGRSADGTVNQENSLYIVDALGDLPSSLTTGSTVFDNNTSSGAGLSFDYSSSPWRTTKLAGGNTAATFDVTASDLGQDLTFTLGTREDGYVLDRIVFSLDNSLTTAELDGLTNSAVIPEPASLALLAIGAGLLTAGRRRR